MSSHDERPGLELAQTFIQTGPTYREFKKWLKEEIAALDAERDDEYDEDYSDPFSALS